MVNLRFSDKDIREYCGTPFAITFVFYPFQNITYWNPFQDIPVIDSSDILFSFLKDLRIESCVSPLHCYDINPDISETSYKLPHYHVVITLGSGGKKSIRQWFTLLEPIRDFIAIAPFDKGDSSLEDVAKVFNSKNKVHKMRSLLRYFVHLDNPEKYQYDPADFQCFCGFDLNNIIYSDTDLLCLVREIRKYIKDNKIYDFCDLFDYADECRSDWFQVVTNSKFGNSLQKYQKSLEYKDKKNKDRDRLNYLESIMIENINKKRLKEIIESK